MEDQKIINAIKLNKNRKVLRELYNTALPSISKFVKSNGGTLADAEDCFQEAVIALIVAVKKGRFDSSFSIRNYLFGIVRNKWFNEVKRSQKYTEGEFDVEPSIDEEQLLIEKEHFGLIEELFNSLGDKCAKLLKLIIYDNMKQKEVKNILGFNSEAVVKTSYHRCKQKLREKVQGSKNLQSILKGA